MLEERLSKAYSQQSFGGYSIPPPRQPSGPYPSMATQAHGTAGSAESFYTGQQPGSFHASASHAYPQPSQPTPQPRLASYGPGLGNHGGQVALPPQQRQASASWQGLPPSAPAQEPYQQQQTPHDTTQRIQSPQQPNASPATDHRGSYYFSSPHPVQSPTPAAPGSAPDANPSSYPSLYQSMQSQSTQPQPTPVLVHGQPGQPSQPPQSVPSQFQNAPPPPQGIPQPQQQPQHQQPVYWQQAGQNAVAQQAAHQPSAAPQTWAYAGYSQDSFPSVPQNDPIRQPATEEALIEL